MEHQTKAQEEAVVNASVFLATVLSDEPPEVRLPATLLVVRIEAGMVRAHIPDRFEDEVLGGLTEAITKRRPLVVAPTVLFATLKRFMASAIVHHRGIDWQAEEVFRAALHWRVSYYDALYLLVAQKVGATYWTADKKLLRFLQRSRSADLPQLGWIGDYR